MSRPRPYHMMTTLFKTPSLERHLLLDWVNDRTPVVRIYPDPSATSPMVYARLRYELTGQRQWVVAPTVELLN